MEELDAVSRWASNTYTANTPYASFLTLEPAAQQLYAFFDVDRNTYDMVSYTVTPRPTPNLVWPLDMEALYRHLRAMGNRDADDTPLAFVLRPSARQWEEAGAMDRLVALLVLLGRVFWRPVRIEWVTEWPGAYVLPNSVLPSNTRPPYFHMMDAVPDDNWLAVVPSQTFAYWLPRAQPRMYNALGDYTGRPGNDDAADPLAGPTRKVLDQSGPFDAAAGQVLG
jgi:hypothetical protein